MNLKARLPLMLSLLLAGAAGATLALAETPLPDPVAPAVLGRPLDQIGPARTVSRPAARQAEARSPTARQAGASPPVAREAEARPSSARKVARRQAPALQPAIEQAAAPAAPAAPALASPVLDPGAPAMQHQARQALDDRADPRMRLGAVGQGTHFARKPLGPGAYFDDKDRAAVRKYYEAHPVAGQAPNWRIGEPVPGGLALASVPKALLGSLPKLPPGHRYVELGGEVVLMAAGSKMVVDGITRTPR